MAIIGGHIDTFQELIRGGADVSCMTIVSKFNSYETESLSPD